MRGIRLFIFSLFPLIAMSQTAEKWAMAVNWDGVSPWQKYLIYTPRHMGPNAIPIPTMGTGVIDSNNSFYAAAVFHFSKGDLTQNLKLSANYCLVKDVIAFDLSWIPSEWYQMNDDIKKDRHVFYECYNNRKASGDMYLNTNLQLFNRWKKYFRLAFRMGYRFPTSSGVGSARFTDAPGYHFDLSAAKYLSKDKQWKLTAMCGFYVWQLNIYGQNDAFMFGTGIEYEALNWRWKLNTSGYFGWRGNGDDPVIVNFGLEKKYKQFDISLSAQQGLNDFSYSSIELGTRLRLKQFINYFGRGK